MAAFAPILINDGKATPVAHTFAPSVIDQNSVAKWQDRVTGISIGYSTLSLSTRPPNAKSTARVSKVQLKLVIPTLEVTAPSTASGIQPAPTKAYDLTCNVEFMLPERSSLAERKDLLALIKNALANVNLTNAVEINEAVY